MREIKGFITNDSFINNNKDVVSTLFELSDNSKTYSRTKQQYYSTIDPKFSLFVFKKNTNELLIQNEVNTIVNVVNELGNFLSNAQIGNKSQTIIAFLNHYNALNQTATVTGLTYNTIVDNGAYRNVDYLSFIVLGISCNIWLNDKSFELFYPDYEITPVLPFSNFTAIVNTPSDFITAIDNFDLVEFNKRIELAKGFTAPTVTRILNIPYKVPGTTVFKNCYFAFNINGKQGDYDHIIRLELHRQLLVLTGLTTQQLEAIFPSILNINEFFITPKWDKLALPSGVGQLGINSQIVPTFNTQLDITRFVKVYSDVAFVRANTNNVPFDYNNIMLYVTNGFYSSPDLQNFVNYYSDLITVTSMHPDFSRMRSRTQRFISLMENMLKVADSSNDSEMFSKLIANTNYKFSIIIRSGITYLSYFFEHHQYYVLPRYEYVRLS